MRQISELQMKQRLQQAVEVAGSQKAFAEKAGISQQYLCDVLKGRREIGDKILKWFKMERVIFYRCIGNSSSL